MILELRRFETCAAAAACNGLLVALANANWDISDVQDWLGHRHISSTLMYFRITNKRREAKYRAALRSREIAKTDGG